MIWNGARPERRELRSRAAGDGGPTGRAHGGAPAGAAPGAVHRRAAMPFPVGAETRGLSSCTMAVEGGVHQTVATSGLACTPVGAVPAYKRGRLSPRSKA